MSTFFGCCCGLSGFGEELYKDWDNHPAVQQYCFIKRLGEGGFSEVQLARDKLTGKTVALKIVFLNKAGLTAEQRKILAGEAKLTRMVAHPNIIRCMQVLETRRQQVLVLEHLTGGEMLRQLQRLKRYTEAHACQLFRQIADAVAYLHSLSIMHRDIKPENCLLAKPAQHYAAKSKPVKVKLIDLGMAGLFRPARPLYGCMGSPGFIAPEVVLGEAHTPAMDVYSLGVLLFVMLVGRKPWDAQRSHTLQYAIEPTAGAPGLQDPVFLALSPAARQLLLAMLQEDPAVRPTAGQVLSHKWMTQSRQGAAGGDAAATSAPERLIQPAVQQRLLMLGNSRQVMGTARGMLLLHSNGSRSGAVAFHKAVKEARLKLQQQAAALKAAGQLQEVEQQVQAGPAAAAGAALGTTNGGTAGVNIVAAGTAQIAAASTKNDGGAAGAESKPNLARPVSYADPFSAAATADGNSGQQQGAKPPATVGQLARASLQRQSLLFGGQRPPPVPAPAAAASGTPVTASSRAAGAAAPAAGAGCGAAERGVSPDAAAFAFEALERGMSVPNPEIGMPCTYSVGYVYGRNRADRAVSLSPGALALLDADDRMCLLAAATSVDDDSSAGFSSAGFSWGNRRDAAEIVASFRQQYPMKPIVRSIAKFGRSMSNSLSRSRSLRNSDDGGLSSSHRSARYVPAAAGRSNAPGSPVRRDGCTANQPQGAVKLLSLSSSAAGPSDLDQLLPGDMLDSSSCCGELLEGQSKADDNAAAATAAAGDGSSALAGIGTDNSWCYRHSPSRLSREQAVRDAQGASAAVQQATMSPGTAANGRCSSNRKVAGQLVDSSMLQPRSGRVSFAGTLSSTASLELAFLGTQLSMSPPFTPVGDVAAELGSAAAAAAIAAAPLSPRHVQLLVAGRANLPAPVAAALQQLAASQRQQQQQSLQQSRNQQQPQQQEQQLQQGRDMLGQPEHQGLLQWQDHIIPTLPHALPAIPSEASDSSSSAGQGWEHTAARWDDPDEEGAIWQYGAAAAAPDAAVAASVYGLGQDEGDQGGAQHSIVNSSVKNGSSRHQHTLTTPFGNAQSAAAVSAAAGAQAPVCSNDSSASSAGAVSGKHVNREASVNDTSTASAAADKPAAAAANSATRGGTRTFVTSPTVRAAATAAAARAEEEGLNLPNGLWLLPSQSLESSQMLPQLLIPALSASSDLTTPSILSLTAATNNSITDVQFVQQQEGTKQDGNGDAAVAAGGALSSCCSSIALLAESSSVQQQGVREVDELASEAAAYGMGQQDLQGPGSNSSNSSSRRAIAKHTRDASMVDWLDADGLLSQGGGREVSMIQWLRPGSAGRAASFGGSESSSDAAAAIAAAVGGSTEGAYKQVVPWLQRNSSSSSEFAGDAVQAATATAASGASMRVSRAMSSSRHHLRPTHHVAVPALSIGSKYGSSSRHRRGWPRGCRWPQRTSSGGDGTISTLESSELVPAAAAAAGDANADAGDAAADGSAVVIVGQDSAEVDDFYVGSYTEAHGLADGRGLGLGLQSSDRLDYSLNPEDSLDEKSLLRQAAEGLAGTTAAAAAAAAGDLDGDGAEFDESSLVDVQVDDMLQQQQSTAIERELTAEAAAVTAAGGEARARGGAGYAAAAAALAAEGSSWRDSSSNENRTGVSSSEMQQLGMLGSAAAAAGVGLAATQSLMPPKQQQQYYHMDHYRQRQPLSSSSEGRRSVGAPATVAGIPIWDPAGQLAGFGYACSSSPSPYADMQRGGNTAGTAAVGAIAAPAGAASTHAGGVAWVIKSLSGKYVLPGDMASDAEHAAAAGFEAAGQAGRGLTRCQPAQYDDFDEPTAFYYAS